MATCKTCKACNDAKTCAPFRGKLGNYNGIRFTADGFDCALPVSIDTHNVCSFGCLYCFSNFLLRDPHRKGTFKVTQWSHAALEKVLSGEPGPYRIFYDALREIPGKVAPIQWGALGDPFDNVERWQGWALKAAELFVKYGQPCRISTKGGRLLCREPAYMDAISHPNFWVAFSISSIDDEALARVDVGTPLASERLAAMAELSRRGVSTSLRMRPMIPGLTDSTPRYPMAYRDLILRAAEAGAKAISMEIMFFPGTEPPQVRARMDKLMREVGRKPLRKIYKATSIHGPCLRSSRTWKEDIVFACYEVAKGAGLTFGISDPHFKELNDTGCCCGIQPDDPVFGAWSRKNATNALVEARKDYEAGGPGLACFDDARPGWAHKVSMDALCVMTGPANAHRRAHYTWEDKLRETWNDLRGPRGPMGYFGGVLRPHELDGDKNVVYRYEPYERRHPATTPGWKVLRPEPADDDSDGAAEPQVGGCGGCTGC